MSYYIPFTCKRCQLCVDVCPVGAVYVKPSGAVDIHHSECIECGRCYEVCPHHYPAPPERRVTAYDAAQERRRKELGM